MAKKKASRSSKLVVTRAMAPYIADDLRVLAVERESIDLDPSNPRVHGEQDLAAIAGSLQRFGQRTPLVVNRRTNHVLKGNGTWLAAEQLGWSYIVALFVDDDESTAVGYKIADNRTAELSKWDDALLAELLAGQQTTEDDFDAYLQQMSLQEFLAVDPGDAEDLPASDGEQTFKLVTVFETEAQQKKWLAKLARAAGVVTCKAVTG